MDPEILEQKLSRSLFNRRPGLTARLLPDPESNRLADRLVWCLGATWGDDGSYRDQAAEARVALCSPREVIFFPIRRAAGAAGAMHG